MAMNVLLRRAAAVLAWLVLAVIAFSTLSPIGMRPQLGALVQVERFGAFAALGLLFVLVYPRRWRMLLFCVIGLAVSLEIMQTVVSGRHGRWSDLAVKVAGGVCGVLFACWLPRLRAHLERFLRRLNKNTSSSS